MLMKHFTEICEPYEFEKENPDTGAKEMIRKLTDCINEERSLKYLIEKFLSSNKQEDGNGCGESEEDEDCYDDSSADEELC